jgi:hypothetical protein
MNIMKFSWLMTLAISVAQALDVQRIAPAKMSCNWLAFIGGVAPL